MEVMNSRGTDGLLLIRKHVLTTASSQKYLGTPEQKIRHLTLSKMVLFILSAVPFVGGVWYYVVSCNTLAFTEFIELF